MLFLDFKLVLYFQWISLVRNHAEVVVDDEVIFPIFEKFCKVHDWLILFFNLCDIFSFSQPSVDIPLLLSLVGMWSGY